MKSLAAIPYWHQGDYLGMQETLQSILGKEQEIKLFCPDPSGPIEATIGFAYLPDGAVFQTTPCFNFDIAIKAKKIDKAEIKQMVREWGEAYYKRVGKKPKKSDLSDQYDVYYQDALDESRIKEQRVTVAMKGSLMLVMTQSPKIADSVTTFLRTVLKIARTPLPIVPICAARPPWRDAYLHAALLDLAPCSFEIGSTAVFTDGIGTVTSNREDLRADEIIELLRTGRRVARLELHLINETGDTSSYFQMTSDSRIIGMKLNLMALTGERASEVEAYAGWMTDRYLGLAEILDVYQTLLADLMEGDKNLRKACDPEFESEGVEV